jgi:hypothetical protein
MGDDAASAEVLNFLPVGLGGQMVRDVEAAKFGDVVIAGHFIDPFEFGHAEAQRTQSLGSDCRLKTLRHLRLCVIQKEIRARSLSVLGSD